MPLFTRSISNSSSNRPVRPTSEYGLGVDSVDYGGDTPYFPTEKTDVKCVQKKNSNSSVHSGSSKRVRPVSGDGKRHLSGSPETGRNGSKEHENVVSPVLSEHRKSKVSVCTSTSLEKKYMDHKVSMDSTVKEKPKLPEKPKIPERPKLPEKPKLPERPKPPVRSKDFLVPTSCQPLSTSVTVLVEKRCAISTNKITEKDAVNRRKKTLHRSQSDLSCRHSRTSSDLSDLSSRLSRTSTDLERFFDEMGIDRTVLDPMLRLHHRTQHPDMFESMSSIASAPNDKSSGSDASQGGEMSETDKKIAECNSKQTSIVETNARIIKWLCNVNKAQKPNQQSSS